MVLRRKLGLRTISHQKRTVSAAHTAMTRPNPAFTWNSGSADEKKRRQRGSNSPATAHRAAAAGATNRLQSGGRKACG